MEFINFQAELEQQTSLIDFDKEQISPRVLKI